MKVETQITFQQYLKLQYLLTYRNKWVLLASVCGVVMLVYSLLTLLGFVTNNENIYVGLIFGLYVLVTPYLVYRAAFKNFNTHKTLQEVITYEFLPDNMMVTTNYSNANIPWDKIHKIKELGDWILIYQSNRIANLIPKASLTPEQLTEAKQIFGNINGIKVELKKT
jgi:hypothetical protein